mmetsp:Transcript_16052/g.15773  ORF Transcript_16052/g.15773 Transcript_16052/m.15773 type:complete len:93 (+) Transcript_16052:439-717(+)
MYHSSRESFVYWICHFCNKCVSYTNHWQLAKAHDEQEACCEHHASLTNEEYHKRKGYSVGYANYDELHLISRVFIKEDCMCERAKHSSNNID